MHSPVAGLMQEYVSAPAGLEEKTALVATRLQEAAAEGRDQGDGGGCRRSIVFANTVKRVEEATAILKESGIQGIRSRAPAMSWLLLARNRVG